jgi:hypothetical protein
MGLLGDMGLQSCISFRKFEEKRAVWVEIGTFRGTFREHALLDVWKPGSFLASGTAGVWSFVLSESYW